MFFNTTQYSRIILAVLSILISMATMADSQPLNQSINQSINQQYAKNEIKYCVILFFFIPSSVLN